MPKKGAAADLTVLLVEDNAIDRALARAFLQEFGFRKIHEAEDGSVAYFKVQNQEFDVVITDWKMPIITGFDLLRKIKGNQKLRRVPIIFLTGNNDKKAVEAALTIGVVDYVVKPLKKEVFFEKLQKLFPSAGLKKKAA